MNLFGLSKHFWRIILGEEQMIDSSCHFNTKPFSKLAVLNAQIFYGRLLLNLLEQLGETIALNNVSTESVANQSLISILDLETHTAPCRHQAQLHVFLQPHRTASALLRASRP